MRKKYTPEFKEQAVQYALNCIVLIQTVSTHTLAVSHRSKHLHSQNQSMSYNQRITKLPY